MAAVIRCRGEEHSLTREDILAVAKRTAPGRVTTYYVEIDGLRFPPKQLIRVATATKQQFNSVSARTLLTKLGFRIDAVSKP